VQAVWIDDKLRNAPITTLSGGVRSQEAIYQYLTGTVENFKQTF
jgi:polyphosphate kinase